MIDPATHQTAPIPASGDSIFPGFERRRPSAQNAVDVFNGRWASDLSLVLDVTGSGAAPLFAGDDRPAQAAFALGVDGRLDGMRVLELGPLEAGHTWQLEQLGASITAVEANVEAYLKCLVVKELLGLTRSRFLLGDVVEFLAAERSRYDLVFCSGILYHMADPVELIQAIARVTDRTFIWTHYYDQDKRPLAFSNERRSVAGFSANHWSHLYGERAAGFWGGNRSTAAWLEKPALLDAFRHFGLDVITVFRDDQTYVNGPNITFAAVRRSA